jgi:nucleoside-diphosphate-sugar epimerase
MSTNGQRTVGITGASGYLGGVISQRLQQDGWRTIAMVRSPSAPGSRKFDIGVTPEADLFDGIDAIVHCAYDMSLVEPSDIRRVNVDGTGAFLRCARDQGVSRVLVLSSMSAFEGTRQMYGQAKLAIESAARESNAHSVRPGLVYGPRAGGMAGTLARLARLPVIPLVASKSHQFTVHEDDFAAAVSALLAAPSLPDIPIGIANPLSVPFPRLLEHFAREQGRSCRFLPVNWRLLDVGLRLAERLKVPLPVRADSLLGLVEPAPMVPNLEVLEDLGIRLRRFGQPVPP